MINKLTPEQQQIALDTRDYWINKVYSCEETNEKYATELVEFMYQLAKLGKPRVVFTDSPLSANLTAHVLKDTVGLLKGDSVLDSVLNSVWNSVGDKEFYNNLGYGEPWSQVWLSFYDFFTRRTGLIQHELFEKYIELVDKANAYYIIPFSEMCIVTRNPEYIHKTWRNDRWVMHDDEGNLAIKWKDGWGQYVLHGITLEKGMYEEILSQKASFKKIMSIENMEHRMLYLKYMDSDKLLAGAGAKKIDTGKRKTVHFDYSSQDKLGAKVSYNELYQIDDLFANTEYFLRYEDPSTGRVYISCIDSGVGEKGDADLGMAWKLGLSKKMYMAMKTEA